MLHVCIYTYISGPYEKPDDSDESKKLSRGQRRRRKGKERIRKRKEFESSIIEAIEKKKSLALNGLFNDIKGLAKSLPKASAGSKKNTRKSMTSKQRHRVSPSELSVMKSVIKHPTFKSNPLSALKQHLLVSTTSTE